MKVVIDRPPLWNAINAKFHVAGRPVIFAWGNIIYNPEGVTVTRELRAHEEIHGERQIDYMHSQRWTQQDAIEEWWKAYIESPTFRLNEEVPAHAAEYKAYCKRHSGTSDRQRALKAIAEKLASPLYGGLITVGNSINAVVLGKLE